MEQARDQSEPKLQIYFLVRYTEQRHPHFQVSITRDRRFDEATTNEYNSELYLVRDKSMLLAGTHEVKVGNVSKEERKSRETKFINRFEVASRFCVAFTGSIDKDLYILYFLRSHGLSSRCVAVVARLLIDITARFVDIKSIDCKFVTPHERSWGNIELNSNVSIRKTM